MSAGATLHSRLAGLTLSPDLVARYLVFFVGVTRYRAGRATRLAAAGSMNLVMLEKVSFGEGPVLPLGLQLGIELLQRALAMFMEHSAAAAHELQIFPCHVCVRFEQPIAFAAIHEDPHARRHSNELYFTVALSPQSPYAFPGPNSAMAPFSRPGNRNPSFALSRYISKYR
jgi:hypothetical protein